MISRNVWVRRSRAPVTYTLIFFFVAGVSAPAQVPALPGLPVGEAAPPAPPAGPSRGEGADKLILLNFRDSPLDQVLEFVAELMGRTMIKSPGINATITLKSQTRLTIHESLQAIETVLSMNNISLVPMGDKFLKVVQTGVARQEGLPLNITMPDQPFAEADQLVSQVVVLKYIEIAEAQPIIQSLIHGYGKIQPLERNNSLLITDTAQNMRRILDILDFIDQPVESKVETRIYEIRYAEAGKLASRLNELIADAQAKEEKPRVEAPAGSAIPTPPGVIRARAAQPEGAAAEPGAAEMAERGIIRGKVKIIADDRTNILFVISRAENFAFFDKIVAVLDRQVDPEIVVRVVALEYAKAEEIASILNEFIGAASAGEKATPGVPPTAGEGTTEDSRSQALREYIARQAAQRPTTPVAAEAEGKGGGIGRLSSTTRILADKRTNALLLMGRRSDLDALENVIENLDIMLAQVLIETVIIEVNLGKGIESGVDWLQRSVTAYDEKTKGPGGGIAVREPVFAFGGGSSMGGEANRFRDGGSLVAADNPPLSAGSLTYYMTFYDLNLDMILRLAASSRDARILSTPVVLTTDNTEAKINVGEERPVVTSSSIQNTGQQTLNYEYRNIGITLSVTPRINPQRFVVMEIAQAADNVGGFEVINGNRVPIITKREIQAQIAVRSRSTIVLGGLVATDKQKSRTKIPVLGDIPLLGSLFRFDSRTDNRTELLVLITPYVLTTPEEARAETIRLHNSSYSSKSAWHKGWSDSELSRTNPGIGPISAIPPRAAGSGIHMPSPLIRDIFPARGDEEDRETPEESSVSIKVIPAEDEAADAATPPDEEPDDAARPVPLR